ncbi:uncharacterized protein LOC110764972 [Prunus avium]|uniref:Uncharacterized protein LOC110764972 n=1 Tax=Prunus avium TaxID=42229 RepID=A0A6P5T9G7_PRUAV|nr:uncharacterized protein LOC110764972 [Prunus avium]
MGSAAERSPSVPALELEIDLHREQIQEVQETLAAFSVQTDEFKTSLSTAIASLTQQQSSFQQTIMEVITRLPPVVTQPSPSSTASPVTIPFGSFTVPRFPPLCSTPPVPTAPPLLSHVPSFSTTPPYISTPFPTSLPPHHNTHIPVTRIFPPPHLSFSSTSLPPHIPPSTFATPSQLKTPKIDLQRFSGKDPYAWLITAERYLDLHEIPTHLKVKVAAVHMIDDAALWMQWFENRFPSASWTSFSEALLAHFGSGDSLDVTSDLSHIQQTGSLDDCNIEFVRLSCRALDWTDDQLKGVYVGGLAPDLRGDVIVQNLATLHEAKRLAHAFHNLRLFQRSMARSSFSRPTNSSLSRQDQPAPLHPTLPPGSPPICRLTAAEIQDRRAKNLCFNCDEPFRAGHRCKRPQLLMVEADWEASDDSFEELITHEIAHGPDSTPQPALDNDPIISIHALTGTPRTRTMRLQGQIGNTGLTVFIDTGSTHNLLNSHLAKRLGLQIDTSTPPRKIQIANNDFIHTKGLVHQVHINLQGYELFTDCYLHAVSGCDLILGADWLDTLGLIGWHFKNKTMVFKVDGQVHRLVGQTDPPVTFVDCHLLTHLSAQAQQGMLAQLIAIEDLPVPPSSPPPAIQQLLLQYNDLFSPPAALPPHRSIDHKIPLIPGATPVNVRPYRYPHFQKHEIETLVNEMLETGVVQPSSSPYSSPVLLVKKKDNGWRLCVDYRALNAVTVKDRFPIPVIDELLDELHGAVIFSKLDLRSGYHQIRMHPSDISKTAFRTHDGHYEFLVMPFGLSNAPSTFQALMNDIFRPYLRKFVLVFFDDILIYSTSVAEHLVHLTSVFDVLSKHRLHLKLSKCAFGQTTIHYLGHVLSSEGVAVDPSKIQCIVDWPQPKGLKSLRGFLGLTGPLCLRPFPPPARTHRPNSMSPSPRKMSPSPSSFAPLGTASSTIGLLLMCCAGGTLKWSWVEQLSLKLLTLYHQPYCVKMPL